MYVEMPRAVRERPGACATCLVRLRRAQLGDGLLLRLAQASLPHRVLPRQPRCGRVRQRGIPLAHAQHCLPSRHARGRQRRLGRALHSRRPSGTRGAGCSGGRLQALQRMLAGAGRGTPGWRRLRGDGRARRWCRAPHGAWRASSAAKPPCVSISSSALRSAQRACHGRLLGVQGIRIAWAAARRTGRHGCQIWDSWAGSRPTPHASPAAAPGLAGAGAASVREGAEG